MTTKLNVIYNNIIIKNNNITIWSIAHIYQAILNNEQGIENIKFATTLAGYIHYRLTGEKVIGIGEGSGIFPVDTNSISYDEKMVDKFNCLINDLVPWKILDILPKNLLAGDDAGKLTTQGALLLDPNGTLEAGIPYVHQKVIWEQEWL